MNFKDIDESLQGLWKIVINTPPNKLIEDKTIYYKYSYNWYHIQARIKFSKGFCAHCNITEDHHRKLLKNGLHMHCKSDPKDYTVLKPDNWIELCSRCHRLVESENRKLARRRKKHHEKYSYYKNRRVISR